jgi:hypothetical protein
MDGLTELQPIRFTRFWYWIPFVANVLAFLGYAVFVVAPWLGWFAGHGTAPCYVDSGCQGPETVQIPDSITWMFAPFAFYIFGVAATGAILPGILGGITVLVVALRMRSARTFRRWATLVSGLAVLGIAVLQLTPMGQMFAAWIID